MSLNIIILYYLFFLKQLYYLNINFLNLNISNFHNNFNFIQNFIILIKLLGPLRSENGVAYDTRLF